VRIVAKCFSDLKRRENSISKGPSSPARGHRRRRLHSARAHKWCILNEFFLLFQKTHQKPFKMTWSIARESRRPRPWTRCGPGIRACANDYQWDGMYVWNTVLRFFPLRSNNDASYTLMNLHRLSLSPHVCEQHHSQCQTIGVSHWKLGTRQST